MSNNTQEVLNQIYTKIMKVREVVESNQLGDLFMRGQRNGINGFEATIPYLNQHVWVISAAYTILMNHVFHDGNKRTAYLLIGTTYNINGVLLANIINNCVVERYSRDRFIKEITNGLSS